MFRLTKKRGRRHKSADSLLVTAPVQQEKTKKTFSLLLPDLKHKDALVDVFLNDGARHSVCLSARTTAGEVVESVVARLPEDEEEYQLYVQFKFGYGRMLEDHAVLSELGDDWGPLVRLALWTRDRRPYRTQSSEDLLRASSSQSLLRPTLPTKDDSGLCRDQDCSPRRRHYTAASFLSLTHPEPPGLHQGVSHTQTTSQWTPLPNCTDSPPTRSASVVSLSRSSAFRLSPLRSRDPRTRAQSTDIGQVKGKSLFLPSGTSKGVSPKRKSIPRQGSVPDQVHNAVATDSRIMVFEDGWSHTQSMPTTPTLETSRSVFPFPQESSHESLSSSDALSCSTHKSNVLHASCISLDSSLNSPSGSESNLDSPFATRVPCRDQEDPDYFDRLEGVSRTDAMSGTNCPGDDSEDYFDRLEPTLDDYFDHLKAPVITVSGHNWDKASFLKQRVRGHTHGTPPPKPVRGPTPTPIAEAIEKWNSKLRRPRVMRITATPERQTAPTTNGNNHQSIGGRPTTPIGLRSIIRRSPHDKGTKIESKDPAPRQHKSCHSEASTSLSNLAMALPSSSQQQRRSSSLTNLSVFRIQQQPPPADTPSSLPHPTHGRISQTSIDSSLCQYLFPDGKVQRLRKRTSESVEHLADEEHLRLTAEEVQALYAATLGPVLCKDRGSHPQTPHGPPLLPTRSDSLQRPHPENDQLRETLLSILMEPTLNESLNSSQSVLQSGNGSPVERPVGVVGAK